MNPLEQMVEEIVSASLFKKEKDKQELRKELLSHFLEESRDLALQGYAEENITMAIQNNFGNIATVSRELHIVHTMSKTLLVEIGIIIFIILFILFSLFTGSEHTIVTPTV
jgi:hypothetical protein